MLFIGALVLASTSGCTDNTSTTTATPTVKATVAATATPNPTTSPALSSFNGILVEHAASTGGNDLTDNINKEEKTFSTPVTPFHRATIDGRDVYIGTSELDNGNVVKMYVFPLGSYSEARTAQAAYVKQLQAKGFTISSDGTTNSKEQSMINMDNGVQSANVQALGFNTDTGTAAMTIYIPQ